MCHSLGEGIRATSQGRLVSRIITCRQRNPIVIIRRVRWWEHLTIKELNIKDKCLKHPKAFLINDKTTTMTLWMQLAFLQPKEVKKLPEASVIKPQPQTYHYLQQTKTTIVLILKIVSTISINPNKVLVVDTKVGIMELKRIFNNRDSLIITQAQLGMQA